MDKADVLLTKMFFYGDYLANRTASGEEESGIRLVWDLHNKLDKEEVEYLYKVLKQAKQS
tara:strand:- start:120 stop:299 length:180 start_codon:yes stop_codon:yes gene_type:complete